MDSGAVSSAEEHRTFNPGVVGSNPTRLTILYCTANSTVQGDLRGVCSPYLVVFRRWYGINDCGLAGLDLELLDE